MGTMLLLRTAKASCISLSSFVVSPGIRNEVDKEGSDHIVRYMIYISFHFIISLFCLEATNI